MTSPAEQKVAAIIAAAEVAELPIDLKAADLTPREALLEICDEAEVWRTLDGETYASVPVAGHIEHLAIDSRDFRDWVIAELARRYLVKGRPASASEGAVRDARMGVEARAHGHPRRPAFLRVGEHGGSIYIDLGTPDWSAVEVNAGGRSIVARAPVPIIRARRTGSFPAPIEAGDFAGLRRLLGHLSDGDFILLIGWFLGALLPAGPYPILILSGEQGSGKSTLARLAQRLTDPVNGDLLQPPGSDRDLVAAARNNRVLGFDNVSAIKVDLADSLCRLATGSEIGGRALFSNHETASFSACRPIILNGIPDLAARGDLADRSIVLRLESPARRVTEREWAKAVDDVLPQVFSGLLRALSQGLLQVADTPTPEERMADFARFVAAAEAALPWQPGAFLAAYRQNRRHALAGIVDGDVVASAVRDLIDRNANGWTGRMSDLHEELSQRLSPEVRRSSDWPGNPRWFSDRLRRAAPTLRSVGIDVHDRRSASGSNVRIRKIASLASFATPAADASHDASDANDASSPRSGDIDRQADFDERAAIAEFDGRLSRSEAEAMAARAAPPARVG